MVLVGGDDVDDNDGGEDEEEERDCFSPVLAGALTPVASAAVVGVVVVGVVVEAGDEIKGGGCPMVAAD